MNRVLYADDCLNVLNDEVALPTGSVDLIYLDPPFNSKSDYNLPFKGKFKHLKPVEASKDTWIWSEKEEEHLERLESGPSTKSLASIVRLSQDLTRNFGGSNIKHKYSCLFDQHGSAIDSDETSTQRYRESISPLRPHCQLFLETNLGCNIWEQKLQK